MNLPIINKKDWFIALVLMFLLVYVLTSTASQTYQGLLLATGDFRLTEMNQPRSYGNLMVTVLIVAILLAAAMAILRKKRKVIIQTLVTGTLLSLVILGAYQLHCSLIVSVVNTETPVSVSLSDRKGPSAELTQEQEIRLIDYCSTLEPAEKQEAARLKAELGQLENKKYDNSRNIWISYGPKFGHSFDYIIYVVDDIIYIRKGYGYQGRELVSICRDNGLAAYLDQIFAE